MPYPSAIAVKLTAIYEDLLWLSNRPHVTPARARAWYSAVWSEVLKTKVRVFSGRVSLASLQDLNGPLCLEHFNRLSGSLTSLLARHVASQVNNAAEFVALIEYCERVNITTAVENRNVQTANGDYEMAGIHLVEWKDVLAADRALLWKGWLRGKVANADEYAS